MSQGGRQLALMLIGGVDRGGVFLGDDEHLDRMATGTMTGNVLLRQQTLIGGGG
jgi:hypothetical protein